MTGIDTAVTVSVALLLIVFPPVLVTTQENKDPLSDGTVDGVVYEENVAPGMFVPFFRH